MGAPQRYIPIDGQKLRGELTKRGITMADASMEIGLSKSYLKNRIAAGSIGIPEAISLEHLFNIPRSAYERKEPSKIDPPVPVQDEIAEIRLPDELPDGWLKGIYRATYRATYKAVKNAWEDAPPEEDKMRIDEVAETLLNASHGRAYLTQSDIARGLGVDRHYIPEYLDGVPPANPGYARKKWYYKDVARKLCYLWSKQ